MLACGPSSLFQLILWPVLWPALCPVAFIACWALAWSFGDWLVIGVQGVREQRVRRRHQRRGFPVLRTSHRRNSP